MQIPGNGSLESVQGRTALANGPAPIRGQRILIDGDPRIVLWAGAPIASDSGPRWPVVVSYPGCLSEPWVDQVQSSPPGIRDKRTSDQKAKDEAQRLIDLVASPFGGSYHLHVSSLGYPSHASYVGPADAEVG